MPIKCLLDLFPVDESSVTDVIPLGGDSFIFKFLSLVDMNNTIQNKPVWFSQLFEEFRPWQDGDAAVNRLCWVLIRGVPPHLWSKNFFEVLVSKFGAMVDWSNDSRNLSRFDVTEILVLTSSNTFINKTLSAKVGSKQFVIGVAESQFNPLDWTWSKSTGVLTPHAEGVSPPADGSGQPQIPSNPTPVQPSQLNSSSNIPTTTTGPPGVNPIPYPEDPFNLRPIINKLARLTETTTPHTAPQLPRPTHPAESPACSTSFVPATLSGFSTASHVKRTTSPAIPLTPPSYGPTPSKMGLSISPHAKSPYSSVIPSSPHSSDTIPSELGLPNPEPNLSIIPYTTPTREAYSQTKNLSPSITSSSKCPTSSYSHSVSRPLSPPAEPPSENPYDHHSSAFFQSRGETGASNPQDYGFLKQQKDLVP
ncbi:hypothetical protein Tsubulata_037122 [Turnera subulata]|uniref:DUF4283 domain-containing protein n=1 Tax=Turnera subulata TaxID=218843 RepID=A0A9Q0G9V5_9ROSI|nr:hypothetical protein Tsubulata_037122 [Turnera subulata]